jgi:hypothetical protein
MSDRIGTLDYASLAQASYNDPVSQPEVKLNGATYKAIAYADNPKTGFQATAYDRKNADGSHSIVIAYRGTEFGREPVKDGGTDAGMALVGLNAQTADAKAFTERVLAQAKREQTQDPAHKPRDITVTGHSLGGTLAQLMAHQYGLKGETFNPYPAPNLLQGVPVGGKQIINHVVATDVVSAGPQFGEVRTYASQKDVTNLKLAGYFNDTGFIADHRPRSMVNAVLFDHGAAHGIGNFAPDSNGKTILTAANQTLAQANQVAIDRFRGDIYTTGAVLSAPGKLVVTAALTAEQLAERGIDFASGKVEQARRVGEQVLKTGERAVDYVRDKANDAYNGARDKVSQGIEAGHNLANQVERKVEQKAEQLQQTFTNMQRTLDAARRGAWAEFREATQFLANMPSGVTLLKSTLQAADTLRQEQKQELKSAQPTLQNPRAPEPEPSPFRR